MRPPKPNSVEPPWYGTRMPGGVGGVASRGVPHPDQSRLWVGIWLCRRLRSGARRLNRRFAALDLHLHGNAVDLGEQFLPRGVVVPLFPDARLSIEVEMVENLEVGRDGLKVAGRDRLAGDGERALEPEDLKQRVIRQVVDLLPLERVGDDFSDPLLAHPFLARYLGNRRSDLHPGKDALAPERLGVGVELGPRRLRGWVHCHVRLSFPPLPAALRSKSGTVPFDF